LADQQRQVIAVGDSEGVPAAGRRRNIGDGQRGRRRGAIKGVGFAGGEITIYSEKNRSEVAAETGDIPGLPVRATSRSPNNAGTSHKIPMEQLDECGGVCE